MSAHTQRILSIAPSLPEAITPELRNSLTELAAERRWREVKQTLLAMPMEQLEANPDVLLLLAEAYGRLGFTDKAIELSRVAADRCRAAGDEELWLLAENRLGACAFERGMLDEAERAFLTVSASAETLALPDLLGGALNNLGAIASIRGDRAGALRYYERALAAFMETNNEHKLAHTYHNLALVYRDSGLWREADALFVEVAQRARAVGDEWLAQIASTARAEMALRGDVPPIGDVDATARQALVRFDVFASTLGQAEAQKLAGMVAASRGDHATAARRFTEAMALAARHGNPLIAAEAKYERALSRVAVGDMVGAREDFTEAAAMFGELGNTAAAERAKDQLRFAA
ncbi:MAG TPA: tetratricopeptide repeat protein [Gemmatimonadaceae bacterium]|jgi:tetratricopeptide (TPR) repeat protein|nr:tetratricopeptide repeat protein [Gemmatimonadaceae bacterium]